VTKDVQDRAVTIADEKNTKRKQMKDINIPNRYKDIIN
jgi:hypothetical protein